ncbi:MAG: carboxypeptidase regulatory-like domain-containing protein [Candidatus Hydrogenedentes bacterium]|nr:carboxypeptidase regulatory-like domain-containing protein [Candidatus Hydrogenedentota bacterium]
MPKRMYTISATLVCVVAAVIFVWTLRTQPTSDLPSAVTSNPSAVTPPSPVPSALSPTIAAALPAAGEAAIGVARGQVLDGKGQPVAGAAVSANRVCLNASAERDVALSTSSDKNGVFSLPALPVLVQPGRTGERCYWRIEARHDGQIGCVEFDPSISVREAFIYIAMQSEASLKGVVTDERASPIPGAIVRIDGRAANPVQRETLTSSSGSFSHEHLPPGRYLLNVIAAGFAPLELEVTTLSRDPISLRLSTGSAITGRVVNRQGQGVPNVVLKAARNALNKLHETSSISGSSGVFRFADLTPGSYRIVLDAESKEFVLAAPPGMLDVPPNQTVEKVTVVVDAAAAIAGTLVDRSTGKGVAHVRIRAESHEAFPHGDLAWTDATGDFVIGGLGAGSYAVDPLHACASGYLLAVTTRYGETTKGIRLELNLVRAIRGIVHDKKGTPVAHASVAAQDATTAKSIFVLTDDAGAFMLYPTREMASVYLQATNGHALSQRQGPIDIPEVGLGGQDLTLVETAEVEGVVQAAGHGLSQRDILVEPVGQALPSLFELAGTMKSHLEGVYASRSAPGGHFRLTLPAPGAYDVYAQDKEKRSEKHRVELNPGTLESGVILVLNDPPGALTGTVLLGGRPVADALVSAGATDQTVTDAAGAFHFDSLEPGEATLTVVWRPNAAQATPNYTHTERVTIVSGETGKVIIDLGSGVGAIEGRVTDAGTPVAGARVSIVDDDFEAGAISTAADGSFHLEGIPAGTHNIVAAGADGDSRSEEVEVVRSQTARVGLDLASGVLEGAVSGLQPNEQGGLILLPGQVSATEATPDQITRWLAAAAGSAEVDAENNSFRIESVKPGTYTLLWAVLPGAGRNQEIPTGPIPVNTRPVEITANEPTRADLQR